MFQLLIGTDIPFMKYRRFAYMFSGAIVLATIVWLVVHGGPRYSVDFTGGTLLQIRTQPGAARRPGARGARRRAGIQGVELQQMTGENAERVPDPGPASSGDQDLFTGVQRRDPERDARASRSNCGAPSTVGPKVGGELRQKAIWAMLGSLGGHPAVRRHPLRVQVRARRRRWRCSTTSS